MLRAEFVIQEEEAKKLGSDWHSLFQQDEPSKRAFVRREFKKWDDMQPVIVTGKYYDDKRLASIFQQKFIDFIKDSCPNVIDELKEFLPYFDQLFGESPDPYDAIFNWYKIDLWEADRSLENQLSTKIYDLLESSAIHNCVVSLRPNKVAEITRGYKWGQFRFLIEFLHLVLPEAREEVQENKIDAATKTLTANLAFSREVGFAESFDQQELLERISILTVKNFLEDTNQSHFIGIAKQSLVRALNDIPTGNELNINDFIRLQFGLFNWAERYDLEKDWLLRYAYFFLSEFSKNPNADIRKIEIPCLDNRTLTAGRFRFEFNGWLPGDDSREDYEKLLRERFEDSIEQYFQLWGKRLKLAQRKKVTKPVGYECVKWTAYGVIRGRNAEQILDKFFPDLTAERTMSEASALAYEYKVKVIKREVKRMAEYDLPLPSQL